MSLFKNKLPLLAAIAGVACAVGTTAFTAASNPPATFTFAYQPNTYDQDDVEDITNWEIGSPGCNNQSYRACEIVVEEKYTHTIGSARVLNDSLATDHITIVAKKGLDGEDYMVDKPASQHLVSATNKN